MEYFSCGGDIHSVDTDKTVSIVEAVQNNIYLHDVKLSNGYVDINVSDYGYRKISKHIYMGVDHFGKRGVYFLDRFDVMTSDVYGALNKLSIIHNIYEPSIGDYLYDGFFEYVINKIRHFSGEQYGKSSVLITRLSGDNNAQEVVRINDIKNKYVFYHRSI